ncbi:hypothetical protein FRC06_009693 [Ceratobasidium sp. 370]|nr:hypothetical protein FRC06_009693 [Ceratobasidium sp. 370]
MAKAPTKPNLRLKDVVREYGAPDLISATTDFLVNRAGIARYDMLLSEHSRINIWHRLYLHHERLPFAPLERICRDVVRASPTTLDAAGRVRNAGVWDTVLFKEKPNRSGYRPGRVRAFFSLPGHIRHQYPGQLAYLELFSAIDAGVSSFHGLNSTRVELTPSGRRRTLVVPVTDIVLACHLAPKFSMLDKELVLNSQTDLFVITTGALNTACSLTLVDRSPPLVVATLVACRNDRGSCCDPCSTCTGRGSPFRVLLLRLVKFEAPGERRWAYTMLILSSLVKGA